MQGTTDQSGSPDDEPVLHYAVFPAIHCPAPGCHV
jgi:hypothetical protein